MFADRFIMETVKQGLTSGRLLSPNMVPEMLLWQSGDGLDAEEGRYGYGVWIIRISLPCW